MKLFVLLITSYFGVVRPFASPFSELWTVTKTFSSGGFEGRVRVPVQSSVRRGWRMVLTFDKPVKGLKMWRGIIDDVSPDFTVYDIINQPWNTYLHEGSTFEFSMIGYSAKGLPSLTVKFQGKVHGEIDELDFSGSGSGSGFGGEEIWVDYDQVIGMSLLFFEAKRSGRMPSDNRVLWKQDSALYDGGAEGYNLVGGYYTGGDYVKFGFPTAFAMTQLAWGALESRGGYEHAGEMGNLLKAIRWGTDFFIRAHVEDDVLFGMVGDPGIDHGQWESAQNIKWRRPAYKLTKRDPGSDLAGETAAALAAASILFASVEESYTQELITHAKTLYDFADKNRARYDAFSIPGARDYYPSSDYGDELVWAALWLYRATNQESYLDDAIEKFDEFHLSRQSIERGLDYDNKILGVMILLTELTGDYDKYMSPVYEFCDKWSRRSASITKDGLLHNEKVKSATAFSANTGYVCALAAKLTLDANLAKKYRALAEDIIKEILGKGAGIGYMVGFGDRYPSSLHDRESSCPPLPLKCGWDFFNSPTPNTHSLDGALVGGPDKHGNFDDTRKNFVGNQPHILHNSAFQSLVATMNSYHIGLNGLTVTRMTDETLRAAVFTGENLSRLDACSSYPCENNGRCRNNNEGFGYECRCTENVFGRNCEFRLVPLLKWVNKWNSGAEVHLELPDNRPPGEWQLRIRFPIGCSLQEIDVWNACINVLDSSREQGEIYVQQLGWQGHMNFIGIKFELGAKDLEHCFQDQSYNFLFIESASSALTHRTPENCPRKLPHAYEGSGSGFSGDDYFGPPDPTETSVNVLLTPAPGSTLLPSPPPASTPSPEPKVIIGSPEKILEWVSQWPYGGQGHIHVDETRPNTKGDWTLKFKFPSKCPLKGIKFWSACLVDNLNFPEEGIFVLEQIDWQIHQSFIGFAVHFSAGAVDPSVCYDKSSFEFIFTENHLAHNLNVNYCPAEYKDIQSHNPIATDTYRDKNPLYVADSETPTVSSNKRHAERRQKLIPAVDKLHADVLSDTSIEITWSDPADTDVTQVEINLNPSSSNDEPNSNALNQEFVAAYSKHFTISSTLSTYVVNDLTPGMKYKLTVNFIGADTKTGPTSSLYITPKPNDIQNIRAVSQSGSSVHVTWNSPIGMHDMFRVMYAPEGNTGNPRSPFEVAGNATSVTIEGLSTDTTFIINVITQSGGEISSGAFTFTKTVPNRCSDITCGLNEICENDDTGPKCKCMTGFAGTTSCTDVDECSGPASLCHEKATCQNSIGSYSCVCDPGYTGDGIFCYDVNECEQGLASCADRCVNTVGSYSCACPLGYTGSIDDCVDLDECSYNLATCPEDTTCVNTIGSYSCACLPGYALVDSTCSDLDECILSTFNCSANTQCMNTLGSYECRCVKGFQLAGDSCHDIDECSLAVHSCHDFATCQNLIGGFQCICNSGYQGDGLSCSDVDECAVSHTCSPFATCENSPGSYTCRCLAGYTGDGIICQDLLGLTTTPDPSDECALNTHNCHEHASCTDTPTSFECKCLDGFIGNGTSCTDIDECTENIWLCSAISDTICVNSPGGYSCECKTGFNPSPSGCVDIDECTDGSSDCDINGQCLNFPGSFACACTAGFVGDGKTCVPT